MRGTLFVAKLVARLLATATLWVRIQRWNFRTICGGQEPTRNRVVVLTRQQCCGTVTIYYGSGSGSGSGSDF